MKVSEFDYALPPELIAQTPADPRDSARLLVYDRTAGSISHRTIRDLPELLPTPAAIIANNSKVRHCRLWGRTAAGKEIELFVLDGERDAYRCMIGGQRGGNPGTIALFSDKGRTRPISLTAEILHEVPGPGMQTFLVRLSGVADVETALERYAELPLPPYITGRASREEQYQTVFAKELGSAAAPTAGLHFTPQLIARIQERGISWNEITLHVGLGTFLPLREEEIDANRLHAERCFISETTAAICNENQPTVAVGTTSARTLESHVRNGQVIPGWEETDIFITPGFRFQAVDALLTNFHLPKSSLLLLVAAFLGQAGDSPEAMRDRLLRLYDAAITERYRFFSFGDAMLIL